MQNHIFRTYIIGITAALAGLLFGIDTGVISGALPFIKITFHLTAVDEGTVVSALLVGAVVGTLMASFISEFFGRRNAILLSAVIFIIGALGCAFAHSVEMLIGVRAFLGLAIGLASFTTPLYLAEIAPKAMRGKLISMYQLMITIGILAAFISDTLFTHHGAWRWMFGITTIPAAIMLITVAMLPKSPRWLMLKGRTEEALAMLRRLRLDSEVKPEATEIQASLKKQSAPLMQLVTSKPFIKVILLGMILQLIQQFSGINAIFYYAPSIFKMAGFATASQQMWATVLLGAINVITTFFAIYYADTLGRRKILFIGLALSTISMTVVGLMFHLHVETSALYQHITLIFLVLFIVGFAFSLGPIVWVLCSEIYPLKGRDVGVTFSTTSNWACNAVVSFSFLPLIGVLGKSGMFWLFAVIGLLSFLFVMAFVPETKSVSLEEIETNLLAGKKLRKIGLR
jgi:SP family galactose:H+ symporter-like MFS transporter